MAYHSGAIMIFIETPIFTEEVTALLSEEEYGELQQYLADNPGAGDVITGTGGMRKIRWSANGKGKSGGVRVIYYHVAAAYQIRLVLIYRKGVTDNLTQAQKKWLRNVTKGWQ
jgi:hypothetical protein